MKNASKSNISRQGFLKKAIIGASGVILLPQTLLATDKIIGDKKKPLKADLVKQYVRVAHFDLKKVKELVAEEPRLINGTWDWGGGDFETAIGAAGHMGNQAIMAFLLSKGARINIFVAAAMGKLDLVKAMLTAYPEQLKAKGPHKLSLMHHAKKGGKLAEPVVAYLESLGVKK